MEPVGSPVGRHVAAVTPDGAHLHPAQRLPDGLAAADASIGNDRPTLGRDDTLWNGRHELVDAATDPAQDGEAEDQHERQHDPESFHARLLRASQLASFTLSSTASSTP